MRTPALAVAAALIAVAGLSACKTAAPAESNKPIAKPPAPVTQVPMETTAPAKWDPKTVAKITSCARDDFGYPKAKVTVTNTADRALTFNVQIAFNGADGTRLADGFAMVNNLSPGQKAKEEAMGLKEVSGKFTCELVKVDRW